MKTVTDFTPEAIRNNWLLTQIVGGNAWSEIDSDPPLRQIKPDDWPAPRAAFRLRSRFEQALVVMQRSIETVPGAHVTLSVSACVQAGDGDNPPRLHNNAGNNRLVVAIDPAGNTDLFAASVRNDNIPIVYEWQDYTLAADASGRRAMLHAGFWLAKEDRYHYPALNGWIRSLRLEVETPDLPPPSGDTPPVIITAPGFAIETAVDLGDRWRIVMIVPKAK